MVPTGLTCKNTFFDIPEDDADMPEGPATCPPASDGWWPSSSSQPGSDRAWPTSPAFFQLPTLDETAAPHEVLNTPDPWMDGFTPIPRPRETTTRAAMPSPPILQTPDWFEVGPAKPLAAPVERSKDFDRVVGKGSGSTPSLESSTSRSPGDQSMVGRTPDPFEDTPSPMAGANLGRSPTNRFDQLLAAEVSRFEPDASERSPVQGSDVSGDSFGLQPSWARPLMKPPVLLATAPGGAPPSAPGPPGPPVPAPNLGPGLMAIGPMPAMPMGPLGLLPPYQLAPDGGYGLWSPMNGYMDGMQQKEPRKKGSRHQKSPLPAGLLLPGEVSKPQGDGEDSPGKSRRKRGGRESKDPEISSDDPYGLLPAAAFIDLGLLERRGQKP